MDPTINTGPGSPGTLPLKRLPNPVETEPTPKVTFVAVTVACQVVVSRPRVNPEQAIFAGLSDGRPHIKQETCAINWIDRVGALQDVSDIVGETDCAGGAGIRRPAWKA